MSTRLIFPKTFEPIRCQCGVAHGVRDICVTQVGLQRPGIAAVIRQLVAATVPEHVGVRFDAELSPTAARSIMREKPGALSGAPRSDMNTNGDRSLSR